MAPKKLPYETELRRIVRSSPWLMAILETVRECNPPDWLVGGGALYKLVWNRLHGCEDTRHVGDVDVIFFDPEDTGPARERAVEQDLCVRRPDVPWETRNQAAVHLWYKEKFGYAVPPLNSSEDGLEANPAPATAVGIRLLAGDTLYIAAPLGLSDLFKLTLRRNPRRVTPELFCEWVGRKGIRERWPRVNVLEENRQVIL